MTATQLTNFSFHKYAPPLVRNAGRVPSLWQQAILSDPTVRILSQNSQKFHSSYVPKAKERQVTKSSWGDAS